MFRRVLLGSAVVTSVFGGREPKLGDLVEEAPTLPTLRPEVKDKGVIIDINKPTLTADNLIIGGRLRHPRPTLSAGPLYTVKWTRGSRKQSYQKDTFFQTDITEEQLTDKFPWKKETSGEPNVWWYGWM